VGDGDFSEAMSNPLRFEGSGEASDSGDATVLGKYRLMAKLGQGGMADVYLAIARGALGVNKLVVIKQLRATLASNPDFVTMFLDEARLAVRLNHPNVVHTYEAGEREGQCFLVMEYLEGQAVDEFMLRARAAGVTVPVGVWVRVVVDALAGLHYAHSLCDYDGTPLQIAHRDVSPQNIFVTYDGQTKVVDFGIAKARLNATVTDAGELKGKVCYMAPEHVLGRPSDRRSDVFAMGVVLWELLAGGRRLFVGDASQALHNVLHAPIPLLSSVRPNAPPALEAIVARALERDPEVRYQSADEMRVALEGYLLSADAFTCAEDVGRALVGVAAELRDKVRRRVQGFMASTDASAQDRLATGMTPVNFARLASVRLGAGLPLLMTPSGTVVVSKKPPQASPAAPGARPQRTKLRRAGYVLMALAGLAAGGGTFLMRSGWPTRTRPTAAAVTPTAPVAAAVTPTAPVAAAPAAELKSTGLVRLQSTPAEAEIEYDGRPLGHTPTTVRLAPGSHAITFRKDGFQAKSVMVKVEAERDSLHAVVLRPNDAAAPQDVALKDPPAGAPARPAGRGRRRPAASATPTAHESAAAAPAAAPAKPEAPRPKVKLVDEEKRSLRLDE
jgi:serine/threonine-protein kinase